MRKIVAFMIIAVMCFIISGCGFMETPPKPITVTNDEKNENDEEQTERIPMDEKIRAAKWGDSVDDVKALWSNEFASMSEDGSALSYDNIELWGFSDTFVTYYFGEQGLRGINFYIEDIHTGDEVTKRTEYSVDYCQVQANLQLAYGEPVGSSEKLLGINKEEHWGNKDTYIVHRMFETEGGILHLVEYRDINNLF